MYNLSITGIMVVYLCITLPLCKNDMFKRELIASYFFTISAFFIAVDSDYKDWTIALVFIMAMCNAYILLRRRK